MESLKTLPTKKSATGLTEIASSQTTKTGALIEQLITGIQADIAQAVEQLEGGLSTIRALEGHTRCVNGLASTLKAKGVAIEQIIAVLRVESAHVARKMRGAAGVPISVNVNVSHMDRVAAVRKVG